MEMFFSERRLQYFAVETAADLKYFIDDDGVLAAVQYLIDEAVPEESEYIDCLETVQVELEDIIDTIEYSSRMPKAKTIARLRGLVAEIDGMI